MRHLVPVDIAALLERWARQERELMSRLAALEGQLRVFEDREKPEYENWLRLEFGPRFSLLDEIYEQIREKSLLIRRIQDLIAREGLHPREALYLATHRDPEAESPSEGPENQGRKNPGGWDPEEVEARRQAKREAKRAERREKKKAERLEKRSQKSSPSSPVSGSSAGPTESFSKKIVALYRMLARKLHPDSAQSIDPDRARGLWLEVQSAYEARDLERLTAVAAWIMSESPDDSAEGPVPLTWSERFERIRSLERSWKKLERKLGELSLHPAWDFSLAKGSQRRKRRQEAALMIDEELAQAQEGLAELEEIIQGIGPARAPRGKRSNR